MSSARVFSVYAQDDEVLLQELEKHLSGMKRSELITAWYNHRLQPSVVWEQIIDTHLESADIIVFLLSDHFLKSGYSFSLEIKRALERYDAGEAYVIPVLLSPIEWEETPFKHISPLPTGGMPVTEWQDRDEAFLDIAEGIRKAVTATSISFLSKREASVSNQHQQAENIVPEEPVEPKKNKNNILPGYERSMVKEIARLLEMKAKSNRRIVLLLGSRAGGLFHSEDFFNTLKFFSHRSFSNLSRSEQFAECFFILTKLQFSRADIHTILEAVLQNSVVTMADAYLAELVSQGHFDEIITTNIGDGVEKALCELDMKEHSEFEIVLPSSSQQLFQEEKRLPVRITKVFGDFSRRDYSIQRRAAGVIKNAALEVFLRRTLARDILVVGIDPVWDEEIIRMLPEGTGIISFVNEENLTRYEPISNLLQERQSQYILASYDTFMKELYYNLYEEKVFFNYRQIMQDLLDEVNNLKKQSAVLQSEFEELRKKMLKLSQKSE